MSTLHLTLAEAPTDVLVHLVDARERQSLDEIVRGAAPVDAETPLLSVRRALRILLDLGYADMTYAGWAPTDEGSAAVAAGRARTNPPSDEAPTEAPGGPG